MCSHCEMIHDIADSKPVKARKLVKVAQRKSLQGKTQGTHESYVQAIYRTALKVAPSLTKEDRELLSNIRLAYGAGEGGVRGVTYYNRWKRPDRKEPVPFIALCATGQESHVQLCGTTLHELAHAMSPIGSGHGAVWHASCDRIGLVGVSAAGTEYNWDNFTPKMRDALKAIPLPADGAPVSPIKSQLGAWGQILTQMLTVRPCGAGYGARGGKSRGAGSGSRYLKYVCKCAERNSVRCAGRELDATCNKCKAKFTLDEESVPAASKPVEPKPAKAKKTRRPNLKMRAK